MNLSVSPGIVTAIEVLEALARDHETKAGEYRDTAATLRRDFGVSHLGPTAVTLPTRVPTAPSTPVPEVDATAENDGCAEAPGPSTPVSPPAQRPRRTETVRSESRDDSDRRVVDAVAALGGQVRYGQIRQRLGGTAFEPDEALKKRIRLLVSGGRLLRAGERAGTVYSVPPASQAAPSPLTSQVPEPEAQVARDGAPTASAYDGGRVAFFLGKEVFVDARPHHIADLVMKIHDRFGFAPTADVTATLEEMVGHGACERFVKGGETHYRKPVESVAERVRQCLEAEVFSTGGDHGFDRIAAAVKGIAGADAQTVRRVLDTLVRDGKLGVRTVGLERRYARRTS